jgi:hypothetical protein
LQPWCASAKACSDAVKKENVAALCEAADRVQTPVLKNAVLTLAVDQTKDASAEGNFLVVNYGEMKSWKLEAPGGLSDLRDPAVWHAVMAENSRSGNCTGRDAAIPP